MGAYFDPDGNEIDLLEWATLFELRSLDPDDSWWRLETRVGSASVSTVWIGINHDFLGEGPPLIFESMIFGSELDSEQYRYPSWEEAHKGHQRLVELLRLEQAVTTDD